MVPLNPSFECNEDQSYRLSWNRPSLSLFASSDYLHCVSLPPNDLVWTFHPSTPRDLGMSQVAVVQGSAVGLVFSGKLSYWPACVILEPVPSATWFVGPFVVSESIPGASEAYMLDCPEPLFVPIDPVLGRLK